MGNERIGQPGLSPFPRRARQPLVRLGILSAGTIVRAKLGAMATAGSYFGFQFIATLYLQSVLGWTALETALAFLPAGLLVAFGSTRVGPLVNRFGTTPLIATACTAAAPARVCTVSAQITRSSAAIG